MALGLIAVFRVNNGFGLRTLWFGKYLIFFCFIISDVQGVFLALDHVFVAEEAPLCLKVNMLTS